VAVDPSNHNVYVTNVGSVAFGTVSVIDESGDAHTGTVVATIPVGLAPGAVAVDPSNHNVYVANQESGTVRVIDESGDAHTGTVVATIAVGGFPLGVAVDPTTHNVYVTDERDPGGTVSVIDESGDAHTGTVVATIPVGENPYHVAVDPSTHNLYVTNEVSGTVSVVDESGDAHTGTVVATIPIGFGSEEVAVDPSTHNVYIANSGLSVIDESGDAQSGTVVATIPIAPAGDPQGVAVDPTTHHIYVTGEDFYGHGLLSVITPQAAGSIAGEVTDATSGSGIAGACVQVVTAATGRRVTMLHANSAGAYSALVPIGSYKLIASDCVGGTHATIYYGGADNYDFLGPEAKTVTVTAASVLAGLNIALPLAGTITGGVTDSATGFPVSGICAYAIDSTANKLRAYSTAPSNTFGPYTITGLPPGTDRVAFQPCTTGVYPLTYSQPVTVIPGGTVTVNQALTRI
jgi:YVTN family beta-propeller protein